MFGCSMGQLLSVTNGRTWSIPNSHKRDTRYLTTMDTGLVPIADDDFLKMPARYPTLNARFNVFGTLAQLAP